MHISYKPLWHTLIERNMRKEDLRLAAGLTTNMIANMGKGKHMFRFSEKSKRLDFRTDEQYPQPGGGNHKQ